MLAEANVHAGDGLGVELFMHVLEKSASFLNVRAIKGDVNFHQLIVFGYEEKHVFCGA